MLSARPLIAVVALLGLLAGCSDAAAGEGTAVDGGAVQVIPAGDRKEPIEMTARTLEGKELNIATLRGKPLVLNVWGSWCGPCRTEAPSLQEAHEELGDDVGFLGIAFRDTVAGAQTHEKKYGITYPSLFDEGDLLLSLNGAVTSQTIPVTLVLDEQGRIAGRYVGVVTKVTLKDLVEDIAADTPA